MPMENMILTSLPADERERLGPYLQEVAMDMEQVLISPNEPIPFIYFPLDAVTSTLQLLREAVAVEAGLMGLEGMVGLQFWLREESTPSMTVVQVPGRGIRMSAQDFKRQVMDQPESPLNTLVAKYVHGFLVLTSQTAACNRMHTVDQRLCRWLRMVYNRVPSRMEYPLRQEFLAAMLGVQRPTVSTAANILQRAGLIEYTRGKLRILNPAGLAEGSCECYQVMEAQFDRIFSVPWRPR